MQVIEDKLVLRTKYPEPITEKIPTSAILNITEDVYTIAVDWGYESAQQLAQLRLKNIPSPMLDDYDWPGLHAPMAHQKTTAAFLSLRPRAYCFNEQGTGKTASCIWASDYLLKTGRVNRVLIVCPLSIMQSAWQADMFKFALHRGVGIAHGEREKRARVIENKNYEYVVINYDGVAIVQEDIKAGGFDLIIIDECNAYKTSTTKRWKTMSKVIGPTTWVWMLTGTPAAQSPIDAHGLGRLCTPDKMPRSRMFFRDRTMVPVSRFKWVPKSDAQDTVFKVLQPAIRFSKDECLDLPAVTHIERNAPLTTQQQHYYKILRTEFLMKAGEEEVTSANAAVNLSKLLQLSGGAVYSNAGKTIEFDVSNRLSAVKEVIDESLAKVLVFVPFKHSISLLHEFLISRKISAEMLTGDTSLGQRTAMIKRFQEEENPRVMIIQPQAAAHGVTLTAASTVIWYSPVTSIEYYLQANARINRPGQKNKMTVVHIQGSPVEQRLYRMLAGKLESHIKLLDLYEEEIRR